jgi:hypothetical protein
MNTFSLAPTSALSVPSSSSSSNLILDNVSGSPSTRSEVFKNLIIVPRQIFNEWQSERAALSNLDKLMKSIMTKRNLSDTQKWNLYKFNLIKYAQLKQRNRRLNHSSQQKNNSTMTELNQNKEKNIRPQIKQRKKSSLDDWFKEDHNGNNNNNNPFAESLQKKEIYFTNEEEEEAAQ